MNPTFSLQTNVLSTTPYSADDLDRILLHGLQRLGEVFKNLETKYGINALFAIAHCAIESAWGTSPMSVTKNNVFGINAPSNNPGLAYTFGSYAECINYYGSFLKAQYLTPGGSWYSGGTTIHNVFAYYSESHDFEGQNIANLMTQLCNQIGAVHSSPQTLQPGEIEYTVQSGDSLSAIAARYNTTWENIYNNSHNHAVIGGDPNLIFPGQILAIDNGITPSVSTANDAASEPIPPSQPTNNQPQRTYTVQSGDCLSVIAEKELGDWNKYTKIVEMNGISGPKYVIYPGQVLTLPN